MKLQRVISRHLFYISVFGLGWWIKLKKQSPMNNLEISRVMSHHPLFIGVYAVDALPIPVTANSCFITNNQSSNLPGQHWIAIRVNRRKEAYYFDPLGGSPIATIVNHLLHFVNTVYFSPVTIQDPNTNLCGYYCIAYLYLQL